MRGCPTKQAGKRTTLKRCWPCLLYCFEVMRVVRLREQRRPGRRPPWQPRRGWWACASGPGRGVPQPSPRPACPTPCTLDTCAPMPHFQGRLTTSDITLTVQITSFHALHLRHPHELVTACCLVIPVYVAQHGHRALCHLLLHTSLCTYHVLLCNQE